MGKDLDPSQVPAVRPNQGGASPEYGEHGSKPVGETRVYESGHFGAKTEKF